MDKRQPDNPSTSYNVYRGLQTFQLSDVRKGQQSIPPSPSDVQREQQTPSPPDISLWGDKNTPPLTF